MKMKRSLLIIFLIIPLLVNAQSTAIGEWEYHLSFTSAYTITQNDSKVFVSSGSSVYTIDKESLEANDFNKLNALSDVGITCLTYDEASETLFIGYLNGNIDLVKDGETYNLGDIKRSNNIIGSKEIFDAFFKEGFIYASTGFGLVIINLNKLEISSTTFLGENGSETPVYSLLIKNDTLYAAAESGLFKIDYENPFIANYEFWIKDNSFPNGGQNGPINQITEFEGKIYVNYRNDAAGSNDIIYRKDDDGWFSFVDNKTNLRIRGTDIGLLVVAQDDVTLKKSTGSNIHGFYTYQDVYHKPQDAIIAEDSSIWIPNLAFGVIIDRWDTSENVLINGPYKDLAWKMSMYYNHLWVAGGKVSSAFGREFNTNGAYHYFQGNWTNFNKTSSEIIKNYNISDVIAVANSPIDPELAYIGSYGEGLIEIRNNEVTQIWNHENQSEHSLNLGDYGSDTAFIGISGLSFDLNGNLWIVNPLNTKPLSVKTPDGEWMNFSFGNELSGNLKLSDVVPSSRSDQKWIIKFRNGILVFDDGGTPLDPSDDQAKSLSDTPGKGNLPSLFVGAIAEDLDGEIWVGTEKGPAVFYSPSNVFSGNNYDCRQILIEQDGTVQILLLTESITAIAIDGGNRKWLGTANNGVFLLSPDGTEQIHHFTAENSPLLDNTIYSIVLDHLTGEVFFGTNLGIVSFRSDAVASFFPVEELLVFPNPVRQDYFGPIAIKGMAANSQVTITDANGNAVNQLFSEGGQAVWYGNDFNGNRVNTGVYFIFASDPTGENKANGKVLIIK
jgi:hypothetical protein